MVLVWQATPLAKGVGHQTKFTCGLIAGMIIDLSLCDIDYAISKDTFQAFDSN